MPLCYLITVLLALAGMVYNNFSWPSLLAFSFITISASPLLIASIALDTSPPVANNNTKWMSYVRLISLILALGNIAYLVSGLGFSIGDLLDREQVFRLAGQATFERYTYGTTEGNPLLVAATFASAFFWATSLLPSPVSITAGLLPAAIYSILSTEKWPFYCALSFFLTGMLLGQYRRDRSRSHLGSMATVVVGAFVVGIISMVIRSGQETPQTVFQIAGTFYGGIAHYLFAQYQAFGIWLSEHYMDCCSGGRYSFAGPASYLGISDRLQGVFADVVVIYGKETNIYTAWRYLVQDFSVLGPFLIVATYAIVYRWSIQQRKRGISLALTTLLWLTTFLQINTTLFVHNSVALAALACAAASAVYFRPINKVP
jgi:oligosaccharide repeat unit polymerase